LPPPPPPLPPPPLPPLAPSSPFSIPSSLNPTPLQQETPFFAKLTAELPAGGFRVRAEHRELIDDLLLADPFARKLFGADSVPASEETRISRLRRLLQSVHVSNSVYYELVPELAKNEAGEEMVGSRLRTLAVTVRIPGGARDPEDLLPFANWVATLIDHVATFRYSPKAKEKVAKGREEIAREKERDAIRARELAAQQKRLAKVDAKLKGN
jgi:hypothetical protein